MEARIYQARGIAFLVYYTVIALAFHMSIAGVSYYLYRSGSDFFADDFEHLPLYLNSDTDRLRDLAWSGRSEYEGHLKRTIYSRYKPWWLRGYEADRVELIYKSNENLLTHRKLKKIQVIEENLIKHENYSEQFCQIGYDQECMKPVSVLRFFDGTYSHLSEVFLDENFENIHGVMNLAWSRNETKRMVMLLLSKESIDNSPAKSSTLRSRVSIGGPLTYSMNRDSERPRYEKFLKDVLQPQLEAWKRYSSDQFEFYYVSSALFLLNLKEQANLDLYLAIGSLSFIFLYMLVHTESFWITFWGSLSIGTSFLLVNIVYRYACGYEYFGFFHILSVFIILGIGADDIFVFFDIWRLNCTKDFPSEAHRLSATYQRAFISMLATSLTTMVAFLASGGSPLLPVSTFGIFSGLLVLMNFISVVTFFPTVVLVYSLRILPFFHLCFTCDKLNDTGYDIYKQTPGPIEFLNCVDGGFTLSNGQTIAARTPDLVASSAECACNFQNGSLHNNGYIPSNPIPETPHQQSKELNSLGSESALSNDQTIAPNSVAPAAGCVCSFQNGSLHNNGYIPSNPIPETPHQQPQELNSLGSESALSNDQTIAPNSVAQPARCVCNFQNGSPHSNGYFQSNPVQETPHQQPMAASCCVSGFVERYLYTMSVYSTVPTWGTGRTRPKITARIGYSKLMLFLTRFLSTKYFRLVTSKPAKVIVPMFFTAMFATFLVFAVRLKPDERQVQMFRDNNNFGQAQYLQAYAFGATSEADLTKVRLIWGLKPNNMAECNNKTSAECSGTTVFDDGFAFGSNDTQQAIMDVCDKLKKLTKTEVDEMRIKRNLFTDKTEIACFMDAAQEFYRKEENRRDIYGDRVYPENLTLTFPFTSDDAQKLISGNAKVFPDIEKIKLKRPLEAALAYWLIGGISPRATQDYYTYSGLIGEKTLPDTVQLSDQPLLSFNTGIKYIAIEINTTLNVYTLSYQEGWPVRQRWENFMNDVLKDMPDSLKGGFQVTSGTWHWLQIQKTLTDAAVYGISIGLSLALPILILATQNYIIGTLAAVNIALVTVCVIGLIPMAGWRLGVLESLNLCLVVGLSVDYVVHLAEAYHRCDRPGREERVRHMLETVGSAVLSGAITTGGAAIFMLFAQIQFLFEFGIFLLSTIGFSLLFSMVGFPVLMAICGPQGNTGSIMALCKRVTVQIPIQSSRSVNSETGTTANSETGTTAMERGDNPAFVGDNGSVSGVDMQTDPTENTQL